MLLSDGLLTETWRDILTIAGSVIILLEMIADPSRAWKVLSAPFLLVGFLLRLVLVGPGVLAWREIDTIVRFLTVTIAPPALVGALLMLPRAPGLWTPVAVFIALAHVLGVTYFCGRWLVIEMPEAFALFLDRLGLAAVLTGTGVLAAGVGWSILGFWDLDSLRFFESVGAAYGFALMLGGLAHLGWGLGVTVKRSLRLRRSRTAPRARA